MSSQLTMSVPSNQIPKPPSIQAVQHGTGSVWGAPSSERMAERVSVIALVLLLHAGLGLLWMMRPEQPAVVVSEMSVSIAVPQAEVAPPKAQPAPPPPPKPKPRVERTETPLSKQPVVEQASEAAPLPVAEAPMPAPAVAAPAAPVAAAPAPVPVPVVATEPDYKAAYLNNPRPPYPMVARRMGWSGKVVLNVEVLAEGSCGDLSVFKSSGHEILDKAAMQTVKSWRFAPARRGGQPVTQWFKVPIQFSLEES